MSKISQRHTATNLEQLTDCNQIRWTSALAGADVLSIFSLALAGLLSKHRLPSQLLLAVLVAIYSANIS